MNNLIVTTTIPPVWYWGFNVNIEVHRNGKSLFCFKNICKINFEAERLISALIFIRAILTTLLPFIGPANVMLSASGASYALSHGLWQLGIYPGPTPLSHDMANTNGCYQGHIREEEHSRPFKMAPWLRSNCSDSIIISKQSYPFLLTII